MIASENTGAATLRSTPVRIYAPGGASVSTLGAALDLSPRNLAHAIQVAISTRR